MVECQSGWLLSGHYRIPFSSTHRQLHVRFRRDRTFSIVQSQLPVLRVEEERLPVLEYYVEATHQNGKQSNSP
jgi:hypothetical protein